MKMKDKIRVILKIAAWMLVTGLLMPINAKAQGWCENDSEKEISISKLVKIGGDTMRAYIAKNYICIGEFNSGLARVKNKNNKCGFIDTFGKLVIPAIYDLSGGFYGGWADVRKDGKWGFIDSLGNIILPFIYKGAVVYNESIALVDTGRFPFYIDRKGNPIDYYKAQNMPLRKDAVQHLLRFAADIQKKMHLPDIRNNVFEVSEYPLNRNVTKRKPPKHIYANNRSKVQKNNKYGYIDTSEQLVIPAIYDNAIPFDNGMAQVSINGKWGYIDTNGKMITSIKYDETNAIVDDRAAIMKDGKWGYINSNGKEVVKLQYEGAMTFIEGLAAVKKKDKWGFIDKAGNIIIPIIYDDVNNFDEGKSRVMKDNRAMYIDKKGNCIMNCP